jgi:subtilisin family serine protease
VTASISQSMSQLGFAPVIAFLTRDAAGDADDDQAVLAHFTPEVGSAMGGAAQAAEPANGPEDVPAARLFPHLGVVYGTVEPAGLSALRASPVVRAVRPAAQLSLIRPVTAARASAPEGTVWGVGHLQAPELWAQGWTGAGVRVAHLDTGVDGTHPCLDGAGVEFAEFDHTGRRVPDAVVRDGDRDRHGTHTAATIAGREVDGVRVGVAPGAELCSALVIEGGDITARILGGMDWAVGVGARVLSMSLGIRGLVNSFLDLVAILRDNGVLPVVAIGNEGPGTSRSPGNYPTALSVGAHDRDGVVAGFSSSQRFQRRHHPLTPAVVAPGVDVVSAGPAGGWQTLSGTSMATPHVAGLAALLMQAHPDAGVAAIERAILESAELGSMPAERANRGTVNGMRALARL